MTKQKKKRTKRYQGSDAKVTTPTIMRLSAEERGPLKEWWLRYGKLAKIGAVVSGVLFLIVVFIIGVVGIFTG